MKKKQKINNKIIMNKINLNKKNKQIIITNRKQGKLKVDPIKYLITCSFKCQMNNFKEIMQEGKY